MLRLIQQKTSRKIDLLIEPPLRELLGRCRDSVLSPFIIYRLPEKARPQHMRAKTRAHFTQVFLEQAESVLMGHSDVKMTQHYLKGHEAPWEQVSAGLKLPAF